MYYGPCRYGLAPFGSLGRPRLFACTHLFIARDLAVATAVSLALQPVKVYYYRIPQVFCCPKVPAAPRCFYLDPRTTQKAFREDLVEDSHLYLCYKGPK